MPSQLGIPFAKGSHTSWKAADALRRSGTRGQKQQALLDAYKAAGERGLTDNEASRATGLPLQSICSLRNAAEDCGLVYRCGERMGQYGKVVGIYRTRHDVG